MNSVRSTGIDQALKWANRIHKQSKNSKKIKKKEKQIH